MKDDVNAIDIKNWREHYSKVSFDDMKGADLFILSCLNTIEKLLSRVDFLEEDRDRYIAALLTAGIMPPMKP